MFEQAPETLRPGPTESFNRSPKFMHLNPELWIQSHVHPAGLSQTQPRTKSKGSSQTRPRAKSKGDLLWLRIQGVFVLRDSGSIRSAVRRVRT